MPEAYIYDAVRTPRGRGKADGALHEVTPVELAATALRAVRDRNGLDTAGVDDVILGCVEPVGEQGAVIARTAVVVAGYAESVAGVQINRFCASGLEAVNIAAAKVKAGEADLAIGGGVESMSRIPMGSSGGAIATDPAVTRLMGYVPQGISADLIATRESLTRADVDAYAVESQRRAALSWEEGRFAKSIVPVVDENGMTILDRDQHVRAGTTLETLGALKPAFATLGDIGFDAALVRVITAAPDILLLDEPTNHLDLPGIEWLERALAGTEPTIMLLGPVPSARKALQKAGMTFADVDLFEVNEAFAAIALWFMRETGVPHDKLNVNGGAIAMGHPLGATGAMLLGTLLDELERRDKSVGLITLCVGGGMGTATIVERV